MRWHPPFYGNAPINFTKVLYGCKKLVPIANCFFAHHGHLRKDSFPTPRSLTASRFGSLQGRGNWERHKGPQTTEVQAFSGKPGLPIWQRSAGAAPCRTALTISEDGANCNKNLRLLNRFSTSLFSDTPFHTGNESFQLNCRSMKRIACPLHYLDRELKEVYRVSCRAIR